MWSANISRAHHQLRRRPGGVGRAAGPCPARRAKRAIRVALTEEIEKELIAARKLGVRFVALGEPGYPPALQEIDSAPPILALRGRAEALRKAAVAIVGPATRPPRD